MDALDISTLGVRVKSEGIREANDGLNRLSQSAEKAERRATSLTASIEKLSNVFKQNLVAAQAFSAALGNMDGMSIRVSNSTNATTKALSQLSIEQKRDIELHKLQAKAYADAHAEALRLNAAYDASANAARKSAQAMMVSTGAMQDAHAAARGLSGSLGALWVTYGSMVPLAAGLALGTAFKSVISNGVSLEHTLEGIRVKGQESVESIDNIRKSVLDLGKGVYGPQEVAKAFETLILAGLDAKQAVSGISDALNLATVGGTSIEKSATVLVQVGTALGYSAESYNRIADVIAKTAAVSMSSVESLSEAFKSASSVGKLYGASLEDIGTSLAALSNLGIQGSAAGTALKNFYKELASDSEKVKQTLKDLKLTPADLKDAKGNFQSLLVVMETLNKGYSNLTEAEQKRASANVSNERGSKMLIESLDLYRTKVGESSNALKDLRDQIENSYGYAAIGAAQMSLTVENQFKSVKNTLSTVFADIGKSIAPELSLVARSLKNTFNSPEFIEGVKTIAKEFANFGVAIATHLPQIEKMVEVFLGMKAFMFVVELFASIRTAFLGLSATATATGLALGPLTAALMAAGAAYLYFTRAKSEDKVEKAAIQNSLDYADALDKEADRLRKQLDLLKQNKTARESETQAVMQQQLALAKLEGEKAKREAENRLEKAGMGVTLKDIEISDSIVKRGGLATGAVKEFRAAQENLARVNAQVDASFGRIVQGQKEVVALSKEVEAQRKKNESDKPPVPAGIGHLTEKPEKGLQAYLNDQYQAELNRIERDVVRAKNEYKSTQAENDALFKTGQIGRLEQIERNGKAAIAMYQKEADAYQRMIDTAAPKNKESVREKIGTKLDSAQQAASDEAKRIKEQEAIRFAEIEKFTTEHTVKELEARGKFVEANILKYGQLEKVGLNQLDSDIDTTEKKVSDAFNSMGVNGSAEFESLTQKLNSLKAARDAFAAEAKAKGDTALFNQGSFEFKAQFREMENSINAINLAAKASGDWESKFNAAGLANSIRASALPALQALSDKYMQVAKDSGNEQLISQAEKIKGQVQQTALSFDTMWDDAAKGAEDFASKMESAFGSTVGAIGKMTAVMLNQQAVQERIENSRKAGLQLAGKDQSKINLVNLKAVKDNEKAEIASYANLAGAAKGLFNEKSKGYKALQAAEQTFRAFQLAGELQVFLKKMFFTQAEVGEKLAAQQIEKLSAEENAGEIIGLAMAQAEVESTTAMEGATAVVTANGVKTDSNLASIPPAIGAGASQMFAQSGWFGFVGVAAMLALMAGLGFGGGGSSTAPSISEQRQKTQGTGTVLGDESAKSESLSKSLDILKNNSDIALGYTSSMLGYLRSINNGITGMAAMVAQTSGLRGTSADQRALGVGSSKSFLGFSSSSTELVDSGILFDRVETEADKVANAAAQSAYRKQLEEWSNTPIEENKMGRQASMPMTPVAQTSSQTVGSVLMNGVLAKAYSDVHKESSSWWGLSKDSSDQTQLKDLPSNLREQFTKTVGMMFTSVLKSVSSLGQDNGVISDALKSISFQDAGLDRISLKGLSGADLEKELQAAFSKLGDKMAEVAMPGLKDFVKVGEGYYQTLIRVASGVEVANYSLEKLNVTAIDYTKVANKQGDVAAEIVRDSIVAKESFANVANGIGEMIDTLDGTAQDIADTYGQLVKIRDLMNVSGLKGDALSRSTIRGAGGLDVLKSGMDTFFDKFYSDAEKAAAQTALLRKEFDALGQPMPKTKEGFKALVLSLDDGTDAGEKLVGKLLSLASAFADLTEAAGNASDRMKSDAEYLLHELDTTFDVLQRSVEAQKKTVTKSYEDQIVAVKRKADEDTAIQKKALDTATEAQKAISTVFDSLKNALKSTVVESAALTEARRKEAQATLQAALGYANTGGDLTRFKGLDDALQTIAKPAEQIFSTFQEYAMDQARTANLVGGLTDAASAQKSASQLTIDAINATIDSIKTSSETQVTALETARDAELARLDQIVADAQAQIDAINGVDSSVKSLEAALAGFKVSVTNANSNHVVASTAAITKAYNDALYRNPEDAALTNVKNQVASGVPISTLVNNVKNSNEAKVQQLYTSILGRVGETAGVQYWTDKLNKGESLDSLKTSFLTSAEYVSKTQAYKDDISAGKYRITDMEKAKLPSFDVGTNYVPDDMIAQIHKGEAVVPAADNAELMRRLKNAEVQQSNADVVAAIAKLEQCIVSGDTANVQQTKEIVKYLKKFDTDGMPETRDVDA